MTENGKQYWNDQSYSWKDSRGLGSLAGDVRKYIQGEISDLFPALKSELVLNLGAGNDEESLCVWNKENVVTLDYARKMLLGTCYCSVEADMRDCLPFEDNSVGMICSFFLMRYLTLEQQVNLVVDSSRVLKKGGSLVIMDVPDNKHICQIEKFDPGIFSPLLESLGMEILKSGIEERNVGRYIETGFGGWYEKGSYKIGLLIAKK